jgi:hypothetical protein
MISSGLLVYATIFPLSILLQAAVPKVSAAEAETRLKNLRRGMPSAMVSVANSSKDL